MGIKQSRVEAIIKEEVRRYVLQNPGVLDEGFLDSISSGIKSLASRFKGKPADAAAAPATATRKSRPDKATIELIHLIGTADAAKAFGMEGGQDFGAGGKRGSIPEIIKKINAGENVEFDMKNLLNKIPDVMLNYKEKVEQLNRGGNLDVQKSNFYFDSPGYNKLLGRNGLITILGEIVKSKEPSEKLIDPLRQLSDVLFKMLDATKKKFRYSFGESRVRNGSLLESKKRIMLERRKLVKKINAMINERYVMRKLGLLHD